MGRHLIVATATAVLFGIPALAAAQEYPAGNVSVGYAALQHIAEEGFFGRGWTASAAGAVTRSFEVVGEAGAHYRTDEAPQIGIRVRGTLFTYMGGARYVVRSKGRVSGFVQGLVGAARISVDLIECGELSPALCDVVRRDADETASTFLAIQPGGGVDVALGKRVALRFHGDYRAIFPNSDFEDADTQHEVRFGTGVVFSFGSRR